MNHDPHKNKQPRLLDQVGNVIRVKHYSIRTEQSYVQWIRRYILFHNKKHPKDMGEKEINAFLKHLAVNRNVSASTQTQALSAILFLYSDCRSRVGLAVCFSVKKTFRRSSFGKNQASSFKSTGAATSDKIGY